jgi:lipopolysaccharide biosynthesis glycosyltransferase
MKIPLSKFHQPINCGVLVMNLDYLKKDNFLAKCKLIYEKYSDKIMWADKCIINKYSENKTVLIEPKWNYFVSSFKKSSGWKINKLQQTKNAAVLHFLTDHKPWHKTYPPALGNFWWQVAEKINLQGLQREELFTSAQS